MLWRVFTVYLCCAFTVAATAFYKEQPVLDFMKEVMGRDFDPRRPLQDFMRRKFAKEIKGKCC